MSDKEVRVKIAERRGESLFLSKKQFIARLVKAGWRKDEAEKEYDDIQNDEEGEL